MDIKKKIFIFFALAVICISTSMEQGTSTQAAQVILEEIDKAVSTEADTPINPDLFRLYQPNDEEQTQDEKETQKSDFETDDDSVEDEESIKNDEEEQKKETVQPQKAVETKPVSDKKLNNQPTQDVQPSTSTIKPTEQNPLPTVQNEEPKEEKTKEVHFLSKIFNQFIEFFSNLPFDKITELKEAVIKYFTPEKPDKIFCCSPIEEPENIEKVVKERDFLPYYFLNPEPVQNHYSKTAFSHRIKNPKDLFPYLYAAEYFEVTQIDAPKDAVTSEGTENYKVLINAPSPKIEVKGKGLYAKLVVDIRNNTLYKYDEDGFPLKAYLVATGARGSRTMSGLRIVTYKEKFPYKSAANAKRSLDPYSYGPYILFLNSVSPKTGKQYVVDQLLHGNGNERSIGKKVSHGCIRTNNNVMKNELSKEVNRGDYILLINPD